MDDNHPWQPYPHDLSLPKNYVHVWRVHLDSSISQFKTLERSLSSDEIVRANRFYFQKDRDRFIVARGMLRLILSRYLYIDPGHVRFCYGKYGKPYITTELNDSTLCFNMSHSHGWYVKSCVKIQVAWSQWQGQRYFSNGDYE